MPRKRFLVTGGAGFVGSHLVLALLEAGAEVTVLDNLSTGHSAAVPAPARLEIADLTDATATHRILASGAPWDGVLHFAALSLVGESMARPWHYLRQNYLGGLNLIEACVACGVRRFVLSSTANLFGIETGGTLDETAPIAPGSPYGESKYLLERALDWADRLHGLRSAKFRYFNAAGADAPGRAGEDHRPETHLIPIAIDAALGRCDPLRVFGTDYPTPDGTCIRDYVHVTDVAAAHLAALPLLDHQSLTMNIGSGQGASVAEVIAAVGRISGRAVPWEPAPRRLGDPANLVADATRLRTTTGWRAQHSQLDTIIRTALAWRAAHPAGYGE